MDNLNRSRQIRTYLVGGAVRDWLLGRIPREYDFAFDVDTSTFLQRNPSARKVGKSVSVILLEGQEYMPLEGSVDEDLRRRDLTVNALALESNGVLHSHPDALADLAAKVLRPASPTSFFVDPSRVFRLARFACAWPSFSVHPDAFTQLRAIASCAPSCSAKPSATEPHTLLAQLPPERVGRELLQALAAPKPSRWLEVLAEGQCLAPWFTPLDRAAAIPAGPAPYHTGSVLAHLMAVMDTVAGDPLRVWMALCHDLGKIDSPTALLPHHYGHELRSSLLAEQLALRLHLPVRYRTAGVLMALLHMKAGLYATLRPGTRCDLLTRVHSAGLDEPFWAVVEADSGMALRADVQHDLAAILAVTLPPLWQNRGKDSGTRLRLLRCQALRRPAKNDIFNVKMR